MTESTTTDTGGTSRRAALKMLGAGLGAAAFAIAAAPLQKWAEGMSFDEVLDFTTLAPGDIVRVLRMTIQLLRQTAHALPSGDPVSSTLHEARNLIDRDVPVPEAVIGALDGQGVSLLALPDGHLQVLANQRVAQRAGQGLGVETALDQTVLCPGPQHDT